MTKLQKIKLIYDTAYFEYYAYAALCIYFDHNLIGHFSKKECPDFHSDDLDIGLEVTEAMSNEDGEFRQVEFDHMRGQLPHIDKKYLSVKNKDGEEIPPLRELGYFNGVPFSGVSFTLEDILTKIINAIKMKNEKLNTVYKIFSQNWLYIFAGMEMNLKSDYIKKDLLITDRQFDIYFIDCASTLYIVKNGQIANAIKDIDIGKIKSIAKKLKANQTSILH